MEKGTDAPVEEDAFKPQPGGAGGDNSDSSDDLCNDNRFDTDNLEATSSSIIPQAELREDLGPVSSPVVLKEEELADDLGSISSPVDLKEELIENDSGTSGDFLITTPPPIFPVALVAVVIFKSL
tara:strand:- start:613 stop:987 length:375 start_codon:yes stop_codon:yes gene_type:complete